MALLNGQTPAEIADEIVHPIPQMLEIDGFVYENLIKVTKYMHKEKLAVKSEYFWNQEKENLIAEALKKLINDKEKTLSKQSDERDEKEVRKYFKLLRAKGLSIEEASKMSGYEL